MLHCPLTFDRYDSQRPPKTLKYDNNNALSSSYAGTQEFSILREIDFTECRSKRLVWWKIEFNPVNNDRSKDTMGRGEGGSQWSEETKTRRGKVVRNRRRERMPGYREVGQV